MLAVQAPDSRLSISDVALAARLVEADGGSPEDPSYAVIARILKEDRAVTPDADLSALISALGQQESSIGDVTVRVKRTGTGSAGFAFDRDSMKITSLPKDSRYPLMRLGDVIVAVNGAPVRTLSEYNSAARGNSDFRLSLSRSGTINAQASVRTAPKPKPKQKSRPARAPAINDADWQAMALDIDNMSYEDLLALEERQGSVVQPGLREDAIGCFPIEHVCGGSDECAICLEDFCDGEELMRLPCLHLFHSGCCRDWLRRQAKCPFCNLDLKM